MLTLRVAWSAAGCPLDIVVTSLPPCWVRFHHAQAVELFGRVGVLAEIDGCRIRTHGELLASDVVHELESRCPCPEVIRHVGVAARDTKADQV
jgi:hypothetical protein